MGGGLAVGVGVAGGCAVGLGVAGLAVAVGDGAGGGAGICAGGLLGLIFGAGRAGGGRVCRCLAAAVIALAVLLLPLFGGILSGCLLRVLLLTQLLQVIFHHLAVMAGAMVVGGQGEGVFVGF